MVELDPNAALKAAHRAREAYERHERRINVQMSLTQEENPDRLEKEREGESDVNSETQDQLSFPV